MLLEDSGCLLCPGDYPHRFAACFQAYPTQGWSKLFLCEVEVRFFPVMIHYLLHNFRYMACVWGPPLARATRKIQDCTGDSSKRDKTSGMKWNGRAEQRQRGAWATRREVDIYFIIPFHRGGWTAQEQHKFSRRVEYLGFPWPCLTAFTFTLVIGQGRVVGYDNDSKSLPVRIGARSRL